MTDECNHEGMPRDRQGPAPARRCLCSACDLALFRDWRKRVKSLNGKARPGSKAWAKRDAIMAEIRDSIGARYHAGIGVTLGEVQSAIYIAEDREAAETLDFLIEDEETMLSRLPADDRECPRAVAARKAGPLFAGVVEDPTADPYLALLRALVPKQMADDLAEHGREDPAFVAEQLTTYLTADASSKAEMAAFHDDGGISMIGKAIEKVNEAQNPSAEELGGWLEKGGPAS